MIILYDKLSSMSRKMYDKKINREILKSIRISCIEDKAYKKASRKLGLNDSDFGRLAFKRLIDWVNEKEDK